MTENSAKQVEPLGVEHWPDLLDGVRADMKGSPINVHKQMAHSPSLLRAWWDFRNYAVSGGCLGPYLGELVILRVGVHLGAWYEWGSHVDRALQLGMSENAILEVLNPIPHIETSQVIVLKAVDELMLDHGITKPTRASLEEHLDTAQIMDLIAIQGMYVILGGFIKTWDLALDGVVADRIKTVTHRDDFERASAVFRETVQR